MPETQPQAYVQPLANPLAEVQRLLHPLLGLHGRVDESGGTEYIGRPLCVDPGSSYTAPSAYVFDFAYGEIVTQPLVNGC
jgi:Icc-related predicted phosphoesterase